MPKKKSPKRSAHKSFKLTPHSQPKNRVFLYISIAFSIGFVVGLMYAGRAFAYIGFFPN